MESQEWIQLQDFLQNVDNHLEPEDENEPIVFGGNVIWEIFDMN